MKNYHRFSWLLSLVIVMLIASCSLQVEPPARETLNDSTQLTMREFQAILKGRGNNTSSIEELSRMVAYALETNVIPNEEPGSRSLVKKDTSVITGQSRLVDLSGKRFAVSGTARSLGGAEDDPVEFYSFETENGADGTKGFVLACNDNRIGNILAIIDEGIPDDPESPFYSNFYSRLTPYVDRIIEEYDGISEEEVRRTINLVDAKGGNTGRWLDYTDDEMRDVNFYVIEEETSEQSYDGDGYSYTPDSTQGTGFYHREGYVDDVYWAGWQWTDGHYATVPVKWNQRFNGAVNAGHGQLWSNMYVAGCGPVAVAQVMAYHEYPVYSTYAYGSSSMASFFWAVSPVYNFYYNSYDPIWYNWYIMKMSEENASDLGVKDERWIIIDALMYDIGLKANANYVPNDGTYTSMSSLRAALQAMGYTHATSSYYYFPAIRQSIISQRPVIAAGHDTENKGHVWVIDGTRYMVYQECLASGYNAYRGAQNFVHCNMGWITSSGTAINSYNGWYQSGIFDTNNRTFARSIAEDDFSNSLEITYDIHPNN